VKPLRLNISHPSLLEFLADPTAFRFTTALKFSSGWK